MATEECGGGIVHLMVDRKQRGKKGLGARYNLQRHPGTYFLQLGPSFKNSTTYWGPSVQHMNPWGTFQIQTLTVCVQ
jgi:hypothetical protein